MTQSKFCFYYFSVCSLCGRSASVSKTCPKAAVSYAARPICFTLVSLSLSSLLIRTHTNTRKHTHGVTRKRGGHPWSLAASSSKLTRWKSSLRRASSNRYSLADRGMPVQRYVVGRGFGGALDASVRKNGSSPCAPAAIDCLALPSLPKYQPLNSSPQQHAPCLHSHTQNNRRGIGAVVYSGGPVLQAAASNWWIIRWIINKASGVQSVAERAERPGEQLGL